MIRDELEAKVRQIVQLEIGSANPPGPDDDLEKVHDVDSLELLSVVAQLESELGIEIEDAMISQMQTVKGMVDVILPLMAAR